jgi:hypothetical protein
VILLVASAAALVALGAAAARLTAAPAESGATRATRGALAALAALVAVEALLGLLGVSTPAAVLAVLAALAAGGAWAARAHPAPAPAARAPWTALEAALATALVAALVLQLRAGLARPASLYDTLSYHLHEPTSWLQGRRIEIVPAVFGDPAPAYAPANLELVWLFLMAPLRSEALAAVGQVPFAALAALAITAAVRESGGRRDAALGAALAFLLIPEIWQQAGTAMVDLGMAACLLAALPFATRFRRGGTPAVADLGAFAIALGLGAGSKSVGAILALPFSALGLALVLAPGARAARPARPTAVAAALALALASGGFWYVRNLIVAGNPVYPVAALGFPGLYGARAMRAWDYHVPIADLGALGGMLAASGVGFANAAAVTFVRGWRTPEPWLALALVALFWLAVPYQESRFLFPAFGVAAVALGRGAHRPPAEVGAGLLLVAIAAALVEAPAPERLALVPAAGLGAIGLAAGRRLPPRGRRWGLAVAGAVLAVAVAAGISARLGRDVSPALGDDIDADWRWFRANVRDARVAYTGSNLAFPLAGERLSNRVGYVNVAGPPGARLHDFPPVAGPVSAEPAPYRAGADFHTWLRNLRAAGADVLFVAALYPIVRRNIATDGDGFPIERAWADAHPTLFRLVHGSAAARVYRIAAP